MASIFQRGKQGIWWIKYYVAGEQVYHSLQTTNARVALKIKRRIEGEEAKGELVAPSRTPLAEFLEEFCRYLSTVRTRSSYSADLSVLRVFFGPICPSLRAGTKVNRRFRKAKSPRVPDTMKTLHVKAKLLEEVTGSLIEDFITRRIRNDGIAPKTANRCREVLHVMFNYAVKNCGFVSPDRKYPNPAAAVQRRREPPQTIRFLSADDIAGQLAVLESCPAIRMMVATYIYAGLRREAALWLTPDDVDLDRRLIHVVAKTISGQFWQPKTKRNRVVPISTTLAEMLAQHEPQPGSRWYFPSPCGQRWDPDNFSQKLREINRSQGLPWSCLDFRHTFGSHLAQKGVSLYKIAELMGNSPDICRRHYAALVPERMHDVVEFSEPERAAGDTDKPTDALIPLGWWRKERRYAFQKEFCNQTPGFPVQRIDVSGKHPVGVLLPPAAFGGFRKPGDDDSYAVLRLVERVPQRLVIRCGTKIRIPLFQ